MHKGVLLFGEPMGLFVAQDIGPLEDVSGYTFTTAGAELNVAIGLKRLGIKAGYFTRLGKDPFGSRIVKTMERNGIATDLIQYSEHHRTGFMLKSKVETGDPAIFYFRKNAAASTISKKDIASLDLSGYDHIHITGITPALSESCKEATFMFRERAGNEGLFFSFDPNLRPQLWESSAIMIETINRLAFTSDLFMPGIREAQILSGRNELEDISTYYRERGTKAIVIKLGEKGAFYSSDTGCGIVPGFQVDKILDTVGAGDGFAAGVLCALMDGYTLEKALVWGNAVGAIQLLSIGDNDGLPTKEELLKFIEGDPHWRQ